MSPRELASVDGQISETAEARIPAADDGLLRGDGVFEVIRLYRRAALRAGRAPRPPRALRRGDRAPDRPRGASRGRSRPCSRSSARTRVSCAWWSRAAGAASRSPRTCRPGRDGPPGNGDLLAKRDPERREVALLRGQHAGDPDRPGQGAPTRRSWSAPTAIVLEAPTSTSSGSPPTACCSPRRSTSAILESITRDRIVRELHVEEGAFQVEDLRGDPRGIPGVDRPGGPARLGDRRQGPAAVPRRADPRGDRGVRLGSWPRDEGLRLRPTLERWTSS